MFGFSRKQNLIEDKVIVIRGESLEVHPVVTKDSTEITVEGHIFPLADAVIKHNVNGGLIYLYNVDLPYLQETQHLKFVEQNIVYRNIFDFGQGDSMDKLKFFAMLIGFIITIWIVRT